MKDPKRLEEAKTALNSLLALRSEMVREAVPEGIHANFQSSALNLLHYLVLRRRDLRPLQDQLATLGLSSLGRSESHVLATVDAVIAALKSICGDNLASPSPRDNDVDFSTGPRYLETHTQALLGEARPERNVRIMVTMPSEAAKGFGLVRDLLEAGMDCMRINCAHDGPEVWRQMADNLDRAKQATGRSCQIAMDLGGPKIRTGGLCPDLFVQKIRPVRDAFGHVIRPARVWLSENATLHPAPGRADCSLEIGEYDPTHWSKGATVEFTDARSASRQLEVAQVTDSGVWCDLHQTAYISFSTSLFLVNGSSTQRLELVGLPDADAHLTLCEGDTLILTRQNQLGVPAMRDRNGETLEPARISCLMPEALSAVQPGDSIWFDDGKIGGVVESVSEDDLEIIIQTTRAGGGKLRADKGINLPDTNMRVEALTAKDREDLEFVARHADIVQLSFANSADDVEQLQQALQGYGARLPAIVLKIETKRAFENLPAMLLQAMRWPVCGVMIARGDLAVECGFERLAEIQEEILWICEAAHVPVIWATQVLENLAKQGLASRSEVTDAAMAHRAECVMLNKGAHVVHAVRFLDDVLRRMQAHQMKKSSRLRALQLARSSSADAV